MPDVISGVIIALEISISMFSDGKDRQIIRNAQEKSEKNAGNGTKMWEIHDFPAKMGKFAAWKSIKN